MTLHNSLRDFDDVIASDVITTGTHEAIAGNAKVLSQFSNSESSIIKIKHNVTKPPIDVSRGEGNKNKALSYAQILGWSVFPCHWIITTGIDNQCSCGNAECKSPGKHPLTLNGVKDATTNPQQIIDWWTQYPHANIAVATGKVSGIVVIDIDINHAQNKFGDVSLAEIETKHGKLCDDIHALTGGGGLHYVFAYPQGVTIKSKAGNVAANIDTRADNGYVIVEPSLHISGNHYEWEGSSDPFDGIPLPEMPQWLIDEVKESDRPMNLLPVGDGTFYSGSEWDCMADTQKADLRDALRYCPNELRDDWLHTGMAIHSMDSGETGFNLWSQWSQSSPKFDAKDQAQKWFSFKSKENQKNKESIFFEARKRGWQPIAVQQQPLIMLPSPVQAQPIPLTSEAAAIINEMNNPLQHDPDEAPKDEPIDFDFPTDCNLLNRLSGFICDATDYNVKAATTQAVIALAALIASRRFTTPFGDDCNLYLGVASSGSLGEIRYCQELVAAILKRCDLHKMVHKGSFSSRSQIYRTLYKSPTTLYLCDNFGSMIRQTTRQSSGSAEIMLGTISDIFDGKEGLSFNCLDEAGLSKSDIRNGDDEYKPEIARPCLSILSLMDDGQLATFTKKTEIGRGGTEQFLFAICDKKDIENSGEEKPIFIPEDVIDAIYNAKGWNRVLKSRTFEEISNQFISLNIVSTLTPVAFECDLAPYDKMIDDITHNIDLRSFKQAARKNMRRLMTVLAAFNNSGNPVATKPIMDWCAQYVVKHLKRLIDRLAVASTENGVLSVRDKVIEKIYLAGAGGLRKSDLRSIGAYGDLPDEKRDQLLEQLEKDKIIALNVTTKQISGQNKKRIVHSNFISKSITVNDDE